LISSEYLKKVRSKALRKRVWYSNINELDRGILNLTIQLVEEVKSSTLGTAVTRILSSLRDAFKSDFVKYYEKNGYHQVKDLVEAAESFGSQVAEKWLLDHGFAWYLSVNRYNNPTGWGI
jgi:hypothetical protein